MVTLPFSFFQKEKSANGLRIPKFKAITIAMGLVVYYIALHIVLPEFSLSQDLLSVDTLTDPSKASTNVISFVPIIAGALMFYLPIILKRNSSKGHTNTEQTTVRDTFQIAVESIGTKQSSSENPRATNSSAQQSSLNDLPPPAVTTQEISGIVEEVVGEKIDSISNEVTTFKKEMTGIKEDVEAIKSSVGTLSTSLESSLTDMKAFQAEMVNPLNFMRKYFETMDIKNLSDPTLGLPPLGSTPLLQEESKNGSTMSAGIKADNPDTKKTFSDKAKDNLSPADMLTDIIRPGKHDDSVSIARAISMQNLAPSNQLHVQLEEGEPRIEECGNNIPQDIANLLDGKLTLGRMMAMAPVLEKILRDMGPDGIDAIVDQYRLLGLRAEDERAIYNIVFMLRNFNMSSDDVMAKLYRLGSVMGIQDPDADLEYSKMQARKRVQAPQNSKSMAGPVRNGNTGSISHAAQVSANGIPSRTAVSIKPSSNMTPHPNTSSQPVRVSTISSNTTPVNRTVSAIKRDV